MFTNIGGRTVCKPDSVESNNLSCLMCCHRDPCDSSAIKADTVLHSSKDLAVSLPMLPLGLILKRIFLPLLTKTSLLAPRRSL